MSAKLPSLGLESETLDSVALASRRRRRGSESASESERSKSELRRSRAGIRIVKRTTGEEDELLLNIARDEIAMVDVGSFGRAVERERERVKKKRSASGGGGVTRVRGSVVNLDLESSNLQIKTNV